MSVEIQCDTTEFQSALRNYLAATEKELSVALNTKMFYIARGAHRNTPQADRSKIEAELGVTAYKISKSKKTGKLTRRKAIIGGPVRLAYAIINARRGRAGKPGLYGSQMAKAVKSMLGKRFRAIGTAKDGWLAGIRKFVAAIGQGFEKEGGASRIKGKSTAIVAKPGWDPFCELEYNVNSYDTKHAQSIDPRTQQALQTAFDDEARSMNDYLIKRLQKEADKINAK
jgi:hypothetical protein